MMIDADLAEFIDDDCNAQTVGRGQDAVEERGFARTEKAGQNRYGLSALGHRALGIHAATSLSGTRIDPSMKNRALRASADFVRMIGLLVPPR